MTEQGLVLEVSGLTVGSVRNESMVDVFADVDLSLPAGEVVLLVGPSGSGKTLFTKLLAGLVGPATRGLHIADTASMALTLPDGERLEALGPQRYPAKLRGTVGYMFQFHALFDELTVEENILFARDQAKRKWDQAEWDDWLHDEATRLKLDGLLPAAIENLSGGQRQRAALLRMLALRPPLLIYDEPTSGLDPEAATRVADLIHEIQHGGAEAHRPGLSLVVTHDYGNLLAVADRVVAITPQRTLTAFSITCPEDREAISAKLNAILERWQAPPSRPLTAKTLRLLNSRTDWRSWREAPGALADLVKATGRLYAKSWRWHRRFGVHMLRTLVLGALPFMTLTGLSIGCVIAYFSLNAVPEQIQAQAEPIFIEEILKGLGLGLYQILCPLLAAICLTARSGAAVAGYLSNLERSQQMGALGVLGVPPWLLLGDKIAVAFMIGMPLLAFVCFAASSAASLVVVLMTRELVTWNTFTTSFVSGLGSGWLDLPYHGTGWLLAKLVPAGFVCSLIAWRRGTQAKSSSADVNHAITKTIMEGILAVIVVFFLVLLLEIEP